MREASNFNPQRYAQLASLFERCRNADDGERAEVMSALSSTQSGIASELRELLEQGDDAADGEGLFAKTNQGVRRVLQEQGEALSDALAWMPDRIGSYRLSRRIGEGGMGVVFEAEQDQPRRRVALKVVHPLLSTPSVLKRFALESEILARLHHSGIAQIYETGTFDGGSGEQPFFAMEFVEGIDLRSYAERENLDLSARLELVAEVAEAVQHAHEKNVIHRDLKPGNILVDGSGRAKVLDFGIARVSDEATAIQTELTRSGQLIGTLSYMAPEQVDGERHAITGRVDVYSLGAIAYELLTGSRPHEVAGLSMSAAIRLILEGDIPRASSLNPALRGDVETILGKALEKDPKRRYATPNELSADLRRYLAHRPISARPPSPAYFAKKFARRHRGLVAGGAIAALAITAGFVGVLEFAQRESQARELESDARLKESEARAESEDRLAELVRMSDIILVDEIFAEAARLWPQMPHMIPVYDDWLVRAKNLFARASVHNASIERVGAEVLEATAELEDLEFEERLERVDATIRWQYETLKTLHEGMQRLQGMIPNVQYRQEFASTIADRTHSEAQISWEIATQAIAELEIYNGLNLTPQIGLVPLGADPDSGLWEFADLQSGDQPTRGPDGKLVLAEHPGLVFVLIPGGTFQMGAQSANPDQPNYDPGAGTDESPVRSVRLSPYFMSKYEMSQGQWLYVSGGTLQTNPSLYEPFGSWDADWFATPEAGNLYHPVERVSWTESQLLLTNLGFTLPTEAQWEFAARGGTTTPWFSGASVESIEGYANVADGYAAVHGGEGWARFDRWLDDGYTVHARVNTLKPNPFGLHHMGGNVWEWCLDSYAPDSYSLESNALDPFFGNEQADSRVTRGGSFHGTSEDLRPSNRNNAAPTFQGSTLGLRPARRVDP